MALSSLSGDGEKDPRTDVEALEGALIDWINTCCPEADVEEFDDLADGAILADVLQLYAPDVDPMNSAAGSAKRLHSCLSSYFGERIELPRLAGNIHNGAFCKPKLLRSLTEAVLLAAVEGPRKEEAVQAIMNLDEMKQMALGNALQRLMARPEAEGKEEALEGESDPPTPRGTAQGTAAMSEYRSSADVLQDEIQEMTHHCKAEMIAVDSLANSEKALQSQLRAIMVDFATEEEQAAEAAILLQKWQRNYGDEMKQRKAEYQILQQELHKEKQSAEDLPQLQSKLQRQLDEELLACREMQDNSEHLDVELREAAQANEKDDLSTVKAEMTASQMQQNMVDRKLRRAEEEEKEQMHIAKGLWENLHVTEAEASSYDNTLRHVRRVAEKEEETEADVVGLLEFRECEMRQLELALGESGASGPGTELMNSAPDMAELRSLLKELGQIARKHGNAQSELNQQQQKTRDLAHRLQQLEDESAQHQNSEVVAMAEFRARHEEELKYSSELNEHSSQSQPPATLTSETESSKQMDQEVAEMQARLVALRSQASSIMKEENEAAAKLASMQQEENKAVAKLSLMLEEENRAAARLSGTRQAISKAEDATSELRTEIQQKHARDQKARTEATQKYRQATQGTNQPMLNSAATLQEKSQVSQVTAKLSETTQAVPKADSASSKEQVKGHQPVPQAEAPAAAVTEKDSDTADVHLKGNKAVPKADSAPSKQQVKGHQPVPQAEAPAAAVTEKDKDIADVHVKGNKALLRKLRQQLAEEERKLRQWDLNQVERKRAMHLETQLISDSIREIGTRCQMLVDKHRALLDDRKRLEAEA